MWLNFFCLKVEQTTMQTQMPQHIFVGTGLNKRYVYYSEHRVFSNAALGTLSMYVHLKLIGTSLSTEMAEKLTFMLSFRMEDHISRSLSRLQAIASEEIVVEFTEEHNM